MGLKRIDPETRQRVDICRGDCICHEWLPGQNEWTPRRVYRQCNNDCFWTGGLVRYAIVFMTGVLLTLGLIGYRLMQVLEDQRLIGACDAACIYRGYEQANVEKDDSCFCLKDNERTEIDPYEP